MARRPLILRVIDCRDVLVENIQMQNSGFWNQHYLVCQRVSVRGIRVWNHASYNVDGIDIDGCRDFTVANCVFDTDDDAVCLKSTLNRPCENVLINNCVVSSHCNAIKMGTDSSGGFINVTITNCSIISPRFSKVIYGIQRGFSGLSLELVDGGTLDRVVVSNVTIDGVEVPIFLRLGDRGNGFTTVEEKSDLKKAARRHAPQRHALQYRRHPSWKDRLLDRRAAGSSRRERLALQRDHPQRRRREARMVVQGNSRDSRRIPRGDNVRQAAGAWPLLPPRAGAGPLECSS